MQEDAEDDEEEAAVDGAAEGTSEAAVCLAHRAQEKKTQADRNREKRRREAEDTLAAKRKLKQQRRELDSVKQYEEEIARQEALQASLFSDCQHGATIGATLPCVLLPEGHSFLLVNGLEAWKAGVLSWQDLHFY